MKIQRVGIQIHPLYSRAEKALITFRTACDKYGIEIDEECGQPDCPSCQAIVSIGGDGTMLSAVKTAYPYDIPVWGINVGELGYLTTSAIDTIESDTEKLANGEFQIEERAMIEATIKLNSTVETTLNALNDVVLHRKVPAGGLMMMDAHLDGRFLATYEADGLIISTPTGSTGYNLSAGGSILSPDLHGFIITPVCAHSFSARSLIYSDTSTLVVRSRLKMPGEIAYATADGWDVAELTDCPIRFESDETDGCKLIIKRAERSAKLLRFDEVFFSDVLRDKLGWAERSQKNKK